MKVIVSLFILTFLVFTSSANAVRLGNEYVFNDKGVYQWPNQGDYMGRGSFTTRVYDDFSLGVNSNYEGMKWEDSRYEPFALAEPGISYNNMLRSATKTRYNDYGPSVMISNHYATTLWIEHNAIKSIWHPRENVLFFSKLNTNVPLDYPLLRTNNLGQSVPRGSTIVFRGDPRPTYDIKGIYRAIVIADLEEDWNFDMHYFKVENVFVTLLLEGPWVIEAIHPDGTNMLIKRVGKTVDSFPYWEGEEIGIYELDILTKEIRKILIDGYDDFHKGSWSHDGSLLALSTIDNNIEIYDEDRNLVQTIDRVGFVQSLAWANSSSILLFSAVRQYNKQHFNDLDLYFIRTYIVDINEKINYPYLYNWLPVKDVTSQHGIPSIGVSLSLK